ncbi:MBL fold metallo-hydrolase [Runella sp.]|uniref:MBL fold metallo-hydrolase n=1 Tax=Runella sp. TaxID=1960881 RepID=UPI0030168071
MLNYPAMPVKLTLLSAGYCNGQENHTLRNGRRVSRRYPALFALLQHPTEGYILFETGYARRFYDVTRYFPNRLYNLITPVTITEEETAVSKLSALGIQPQQIRYVIVSHFHADHVAGTKDFPNARFICSETACIFARNTRGLRALSAAYIPELLPDDFFDRTEILSPASARYRYDEFWVEQYDLFGDGLLRMVPLPGHARGQMGVLVQTAEREIFLAADVCWHSVSFRSMTLPPRTSGLIMDSWSDFVNSLTKVHHYHLTHLDTLIVPTHCQEIANFYNHTY